MYNFILIAFIMNFTDRRTEVSLIQNLMATVSGFILCLIEAQLGRIGI